MDKVTLTHDELRATCCDFAAQVLRYIATEIANHQNSKHTTADILGALFHQAEVYDKIAKAKTVPQDCA